MELLTIIGNKTLLLDATEGLITLPPCETKNPNSEKSILKALNRIGKILIDNCCFLPNDETKIVPLWVEAYYCNPEQGYEDPTTDDYMAFHGKSSKGQIDKFGYLYHGREGGKYRRIDLVLSNSPKYALSFLLKAASKENKESKIILNQGRDFDELANKSGLKLVISDNKKEEESSHSSVRVFKKSKQLLQDLSEKACRKKHYMDLPNLAVFHSENLSRKEDCQPRTNYNRLFK